MNKSENFLKNPRSSGNSVGWLYTSQSIDRLVYKQGAHTWVDPAETAKFRSMYGWLKSVEVLLCWITAQIWNKKQTFRIHILSVFRHHLFCPDFSFTFLPF